MLPLLRLLVVPLAITILIAACGGGNIASKLANAPEYAPKNQTKCGVTKSQAKPLIVEWPSAERQGLETKIRQGMAVVRYVGCEMSVLDRCSVPSKYTYQGSTREQDKVEMKDEDALYTRLPLGAAEFEATLQRTGRLTVDTSLVGVFQAEKASVRADELQGDCAGATHFVYAVAVGAFDFYSGGQANVGADAGFGNFGAGGHSEAERTTLKKAGDLAACDKATTGDKLPPEGCGALIRVEVYPLGEAKQYSPTCPGGTQWDGSQCVGQKVVTQVQCPGGTTWNGSQCVGSAPTGEGARNGGARLPDVSAVRGSGSTTSPSPVKVRINTDPDGASVREDGVELCSSTPCDILYKGSDAEPTMVHKLTFARNGYRSETRTLRVAESPLSVKLTTGDTAASLQPMSGSGGSSPPPAAAQDTHAAVPAVGPGRFTVVTVGGQGGQWHVKVRIDLPQPPSTGVVDTFFTFVKHPSGARQIQRMSVNYGNASGQVFKSVYFEFDLTHAQGFFDPGDYDVWIAGPNGNIGAAQSVSLR